MSGIFVNYRHGPHSVSVAALADRLAAHFGPDQVFVDHQMRSGSRYPDELRAKLKAADVLVAVIHTGWVDTFDREPPDWVHWEIRTALADGKEVVPLLLEDTPPPKRAELPEDMGELAMRQVARLRAGHLPEDVDALLLRLESWVPSSQPATPRPYPKRPRTWLRAAPLSAGAALLPFLLAAADDNDWPAYMSAALVSLLTMIATTAVFFLQLLTVNWGTRLDRRTHALPYRQFMRKYWVVNGLFAVCLVIALVEFARQGDRWRTYVALVVAVIFAYFVDRLMRQEIEHDEEWPPAPSLEPPKIRRTATRLHDVLTTPRTPYRSRLLQQQATQVYLDLAETRLALAARRDLPWRPWLTAGHSLVPLVYPVWTVGIAGLVTTSLIMRTAPSPRFYLIGAVTVLVAAATAAVAIMLDRLAKRRADGQMVDEMTERQQTLGPLVFVRGDPH